MIAKPMPRFNRILGRQDIIRPRHLVSCALALEANDREGCEKKEDPQEGYRGPRIIAVAGNLGDLWGEQHGIETRTKPNHSWVNSGRLTIGGNYSRSPYVFDSVTKVRPIHAW